MKFLCDKIKVTGEVTANLTEDTDEIVSGLWDAAQVTNFI